ncbi:hypothetical protein [Taibaiella helva]|uniref:hypothetical protein n=1 Tax=Taibaiella helva TaxID=2301235 RepID=UPI0013006611|nr:hypothetical protein [Taibaiella helva]
MFADFLTTKNKLNPWGMPPFKTNAQQARLGTARYTFLNQYNIPVAFIFHLKTNKTLL